ncbi:DGQHR domain-containing protein [Sphingomonas ginsenosidivorax]|uniref:DGQHR domain-containing protein n=1 Tax=Sphingomonas ginsenosidivorax TaxID=862135 RepID=A0A5C6UHA9_9SPHN|nr:DNA sulfur modification protein DndB [Sphingomonas ginsenosidivorax]TXC71348.1 DGQHR domain-containing protein [Sphingomonas ginsenosidivorax]
MTIGPIHLPALSARLGDWSYYTTIMRLRDAAERIQFASDVNEVRPGRQLSDLIQRALSEGRAAEIGRYLVNEGDHFFNSLVVAVYGGDPEWMEFNVSSSPTSSANRDIGDVDGWARSAFGFLYLAGGETLFALDGQHRLGGIKKAVSEKALVGDEQISVIFVSHKLNTEGRKRTRKLFTTLNKTAKAVNKSEIIALDESDAAAIITRKLVEEHPYFSRGQVLVKYGTANLSKTDAEHFMTIIKLYDVVAFLLANVVNSMTREQRAELRFVRPRDADLVKYYERVAAFMEKFVSGIPELKDYFSKTGEPAKSVVKDQRFTRKNVLFRSVGLDVFLRMLPELIAEEGGGKKAIAALAMLPRSFTEKPYRDVMYSVGDNRIINGKIKVTTRLLRHMLGYDDKDPEQLRVAYAEAMSAEPASVRLPRRIPR